MKRFCYLRDPLFIASCTGYATNRLLLAIFPVTGFARTHLNDVLLIPAALPAVLWIHQTLGLRSHDGPPTCLEIGSHLAVWSLVCEWAGPHVFAGTTGDWWDVIAYSLGALISGLWWAAGVHR